MKRPRIHIDRKFVPLLATALVLIGLYVAGCVSFRGFGSLRVLVNLFGDNAFIGVAAVGMTFVILSGGIDLSVGSVIAFTGIFVARLVASGVHPLAAMVAAVGLGALLGASMGGLIHAFEMPPFLVTLGGMFFARGMGFVVRAQSLGIKHEFYSNTITRTLAIPLNQRLHIPFTAICFVLAAGIGIWIAWQTRFGRNVYAIGSNERSALLMGVPVGRTKVLIYAFSGLCSSLAGCVATFYMQSGNPASFVGLELDVIASVVVGGTLLTGGVGYVAGTVMGVLILGLIQNLISFQGSLNSWWTRIAVGLLLFVFIAMQRVLARGGKH